MANKKFWLGLLITALVVGTAVIGCDIGANDGTNNGSAGSDITYTVTANGKLAEETTTQLTLTFSKPVELNDSHIGVIGDEGIATKGTLTGSGKTWYVGIEEVVAIGNVKVKITKPGIESGKKDVTIHKKGVAPDITYTVTANGELAVTTSSQLTFTFSAEISDLEAGDIEIINGTGKASNGILISGAGKTWNLEITDIEAGSIKVRIDSPGIESGEKTVEVHKEGVTPDIPYTVTANGKAAVTTSTQLTFAFSRAVSDLQAADITITNSTGTASKGNLTGGGASWNLEITGIEAGTVEVKIAKTGIESGEKTVAVHKEGVTPSTNTYTVTANGAANTGNSTQLTFAFSAELSNLKATDITFTNGSGTANKGTLTGSGTTWKLDIKVVTAGTVKVRIIKTGVENGEKTVMVHKDSAAGITSARAIELTNTEWEEGFLAKQDDVLWYKFEAEEGKDYCVQWRDNSFDPFYEGAIHSALVQVTAYKSDGVTLVSEDLDEVVGSTDVWPISDVSGTVYLKVELPPGHFTNYSPGSFVVRFCDSELIGPQVATHIWSVTTSIAPSVVVSWYTSVVSWYTDSDEASSSYRVYRSNTQNGTYTKIGEVPCTSSSYTDRNVRAGRSYWYKVAGCNSKGEGDRSNPKESGVIPEDNATVLVFGTVIDGDIKVPTQVDWYKFTAEAGKTYRVQWESKSGNHVGFLLGPFTGRPMVSAFSAQSPIEDFQWREFGWSPPPSVSGVNGTVYIKVEVRFPDDIGTYNIKVYEDNG